jgi:hypothetical protein
VTDPVEGRGQGIGLRTGFFRLDWTLRFTRTTVVTDGRVDERPWGEHFFPVEAGPHEVEVSYRYLGLSPAGRASALIDVAPNEIRRASYRAPKSVLIAFLPGTLTLEPPRQS